MNDQALLGLLPSYTLRLPFRRRGEDEPIWRTFSISIDPTEHTIKRLREMSCKVGFDNTHTIVQALIDKMPQKELIKELQNCLYDFDLPKGVWQLNPMLEMVSTSEEYELPLEPASLVHDQRVGTSVPTKEFDWFGDAQFMIVENPELLQRWVEYAADVADRKKRAKQKARDEWKQKRDERMAQWIQEKGSENLKAKLYEAGDELGKVRGAYIREKASYNLPGWTAIPYSALRHTSSPAIDRKEHREDIDYSILEAQLTSSLLIAVEEGSMSGNIIIVAMPGYKLLTKLKPTFTVPVSLAFDLQDDIVVLEGVYDGYLLVRSIDLASTKKVMWRVLSEGVKRRGESALEYLAPSLEDARWQHWLEGIPNIDQNNKRVKTWIESYEGRHQSGLWSPREVALANLLDLSDGDPKAMMQMGELIKQVVA